MRGKGTWVYDRPLPDGRGSVWVRFRAATVRSCEEINLSRRLTRITHSFSIGVYRCSSAAFILSHLVRSGLAACAAGLALLQYLGLAENRSRQVDSVGLEAAQADRAGTGGGEPAEHLATLAAARTLQQEKILHLDMAAFGVQDLADGAHFAGTVVQADDVNHDLNGRGQHLADHV